MQLEVNIDFILLILILGVVIYTCIVFLDYSKNENNIQEDPIIHKKEGFDGTGKGFSIYYKPQNSCEKDVYPGSYITSNAINNSHDCIVSQKKMVSLK